MISNKPSAIDSTQTETSTCSMVLSTSHGARPAWLDRARWGSFGSLTLRHKQRDNTVTDAKTPTDTQVQRFETERIHASSTVLILAALGLAIWGFGRLMSASAHPVHLPPVGAVLIVIAIVLHVDHLTFRLGRVTVVLIILGAVLLGIGSLLYVLNDGGTTYLYFNGVGYVLGGVGVAMVAVHKEREMQRTLDECAKGNPYRSQVTVHASFLSLITAASGLTLYGLGLMATVNAHNRNPYILMCGGAILVAIGIISHVEHLVPRIGLVAVIAAIAGAIFFAIAWIPGALNPANIASSVISTPVCLGIGALLGALAFLLAFLKKRSTDR